MSEGRQQDTTSEAPRWVFRRAACSADSLLEKDVRQLVERDTEDMNKFLECRGEKYRYEVVKEKLTLRVVQKRDRESLADVSFESTGLQLRFLMSGQSDVVVTPRWDAEEMRCHFQIQKGPSSRRIELEVFVRENLERFFFGAAGIP